MQTSLQFKRLPLFITMIFVFSLLAACSPQAPAIVEVTRIVPQTVVVTQLSTVFITATPLPATETPTPVPATPTPAFTPTPAETATPLMSPTPTAGQLQAKFLSAGTFPENRREWIPNETFGLAINFQNTGTETWSPGYTLVMTNWTGEVTAKKEAPLGKYVAPGEKCEFDIAAFGSEELGLHVWVYQLFTDFGVPVPGGVAVFTYTAQ